MNGRWREESMWEGTPDWGLTDCISFVVMQDEELVLAATGDRHFSQAGFQLLLMS